MRLGKILADRFPTIINIKRSGRNLIVINFKFSFDANQFIQSSNTLPGNWLTYIPSYKIHRVGMVRGVVSLSVEEIYQEVKWRDRPIEIKSITRMKFRDRNNNNELRDSSLSRLNFFRIFSQNIYPSGMLDPK